DVYQLPDGSLFDSFSGTLVKDGISKQLPPQSVLLLKLFLRKDNHRLSTNEIEQELWNGQGSADKIHKAIQRLRSELKKSSSDLVVKNVNGDYELK
ncbi:MAG: helix-turn-helix domain-containing protein, partial [Tyzzerella sp.]|nr:helix-turn-helix domain-containing protein [Tyzzerella sp.]